MGEVKRLSPFRNILMKKELDEKLVKDFPLLFADRFGDMRSTCMCWGFACGNGWEPIIREAAKKLEPIIQKYIDDNPSDKYHPRASQIKEKFGTLRFYLSHGTDEMFEIAEQAESKSADVCEECGEKGELRQGSWFRTLCDGCTLKYRGTLEETELL